MYMVMKKNHQYKNSLFFSHASISKNPRIEIHEIYEQRNQITGSNNPFVSRSSVNYHYSNNVMLLFDMSFILFITVMSSIGYRSHTAISLSRSIPDNYIPAIVSEQSANMEIKLHCSATIVDKLYHY